MISNQWDKKQFETGRSMTEMLGVLAIIAVLTITAIVGYQYAVSKHRANQTIEELSQRALIVGQQVSQGRTTLSMDEFPLLTRQGYTVSARYSDSGDQFELLLNKAPVSVCKRILESGWKMPIMKQANGIVYAGNIQICEMDEGMGTSPEMIFQFDPDMDESAKPSGYCDTNADCNGCDVCQDNMCVSSCTGTERCAIDTVTGAEVCCPKDKRSGPYCCAVKNNGMCCNEYGQCCPWYSPLISTEGGCYACDNSGRVNVTGVNDNCNVCNEREVIDNYCYLKCPSDKVIRDGSGICKSCDDPSPFSLLWGRWDDCTNLCPNRLLVQTDSTQVSRYCILPCGSGIYTDQPLTDRNGKCRSCDETQNIQLSDTDLEKCALCTNRTLIGYTCTLTCPTETPLADISGRCHSCDTETVVNVSGDQSLCAVCPNRFIFGTFSHHCVLPCPSDKPLRASNGTCHACDESAAIDVRGYLSNCDICPDRKLEGNYCIKGCPDDKPLSDISGNCYSCDEPLPVNTGESKVMCDKCPNRTLGGAWNTKCYLPCDEGIYEGMPLVDDVGRCHACDTPEKVKVSWTPQACKSCSNRELDGDYCVLKE